VTVRSAAADLLDEHEHGFQQLLAQAARRSQAGHHGAAAVYAQAAAFHAWLNHTGRFASPELEAIVAAAAAAIPSPAGRRLGPTDDPGPRRADAPPSVLHVATQTYPTGGHTQMLTQWIEQDRAGRHRLVVTRQATVPVPVKVTDRPGLVGVDLLDRRPGGLLRRAAALRRRAASADLVVLHTHPYDVVPLLALSTPGMPAVVTVNHADHVFWVGVGVTTVLANLRGSGSRLAVDRRGVDERRCLVMPRPLMPASRQRTREDAKRSLGLRPQDVVIVTAADGSKYGSVGGPVFLDLLVPVLQANPDVVLVAAGPSPVGRWASAGAEAGVQGRIRALGRLPDVRGLHEAADLYVDSFPFSSLTSMLEAASYGTPVVTYRGHPRECLVLGADSIGLDDHMLCPDSPRAEAVGALAADPAPAP
jgi:glycosyltransferase involved in cell wall biosynthesis